jgi:hypothetical protein
MLERFRKYIEDHHQLLVVVFTIFMIVVMSAFKTCSSQIKESEVYDYIISSCIKNHQIVFQQVLKETGHLKCTSCSLDQNNLFGFRFNHKYLEFETWKDSVDYYERWQIRKGLKSGEDYHEFLVRKWGAPDMINKYIPRLKRIKTSP